MRERAGPNAFKGLPNANCGKRDHVECFSADALLKDVFMDSDTAMAVLSHVPGGTDTNPLDFERPAPRGWRPTRSTAASGCCCTAAACRRLPGEIEAMDAQAAAWKLSAFKTYTQFGPRDGPEGFRLDDDRFGTPFIERARKLGVRNICVHKGLAFGARGYAFSLADDVVRRRGAIRT